jgi:curved DNA-binding protein CbpA
VEELCRCGVGTPEQVHRVVYALCQTRQLELGLDQPEPVGYREPLDSPASVAPPPSRPSLPSLLEPPSSRRSRAPALGGAEPRPAPGRPSESSSPRNSVLRLSTEKEAFRAEVSARRQLEKSNFYEVLGVDATADLASIRGAFLQLARRWHPDKLPSELDDLRTDVTRIFARMSEAHQVLSDPKQRAQYDAGLRSGENPEEQEQILAVLRAATAFQRAEVLAKKQDAAGALREARAAHEGDPSQAEYAALFAWLEARFRKDEFDDLVQIMDDAVRSEPDNVRIRWYRGQLYKKLGKEAQAMRDFRHVVELAPHHVEAQRELRVYEMRRKAGSNQATGLFSRWRKK